MLARRRDEQGASALELSFIAPALILLIFFSIQGALYFYGHNVAIQAAREGVSQLRLARNAAEYEARRSQVVDNTERFAQSLGRQSLLDPVATPGFDDERGRATMVVTGRVITLVPGLTLTVRAQAAGSVERFEGDAP